MLKSCFLCGRLFCKVNQNFFVMKRLKHEQRFQLFSSVIGTVYMKSSTVTAICGSLIKGRKTGWSGGRQVHDVQNSNFESKFHIKCSISGSDFHSFL